MNIKELAEKYKLTKDDFWNHKQSGQWIIKHDAIEKIATIEEIEIDNIKVLNSERDFVRFLITMTSYNKETGESRSVTTIGEADKSNCMSNYIGSMAEKRGIDRAVLKLINAYEYGISSEVEAEDFKKPTYYAKTNVQKSDFDSLVGDKCFEGMVKQYQKRFKETANDSEVNELMQEMIKMKEIYNSAFSQQIKES